MTYIDRTEEVLTESTAEEPARAEAAGSALDRIRQARALAQAGDHIDAAIPNNGGMLGVRLRPVDAETLSTVIKKAQKAKHGLAELYANCDVIIGATEHLLIRDDADGEWRPLEVDGRPAEWNAALADMLGFRAETAREVLRGVFQRDLAVIAFAGEMGQWSEGERGAAEEAFARD